MRAKIKYWIPALDGAAATLQLGFWGFFGGGTLIHFLLAVCACVRDLRDNVCLFNTILLKCIVTNSCLSLIKSDLIKVSQE